jgi:glutamate--cysteine ligase
MARDQVDLTPIERRDEHVAWLAQGVRPKSQFRIGTEHEKFAFTLSGHAPVPYGGPRGIQALLNGMRHVLGWDPIMEGENIIGLFDVTGGGAISLEPGGQFELSGAPVRTVHQTSAELVAHLAQVREIARPLGIGFLGIGMTPKWTRQEMPMMPKGRYRIMTAYMPKVGTLGLDMMYRTCTVQVNLDFSSEADMVKKLRASLALQPIATALFANSPFTEGKPNGYLSFRSEIWRDTDNARAGMLPWAFEDGMGFERWVDYALDVPMYFVKRGDRYIDVAGQSFRDLMAGKLPGLPGERATISDWANHISTIFPEVRLKRYLEMRGADGGPWRTLPALPAFWVGLLYDESCLNAAWDLVKNWTAEERQKLRDDVPRLGFEATIRGERVRDIARDCLGLAHSGLKRRGHLDNEGRDETRYLEPLGDIVRRGYTAAENLLAKFHHEWNGSVEQIRMNSSISSTRSSVRPSASSVLRPNSSADSNVSRISKSTSLARSSSEWRRSNERT